MDKASQEILQSMIERKAEHLLNSIDDIALPLFRNNPAMSRVAKTFLNAKKKEFVPKVQEYCDLLVETACLDSNATLQQGIVTAEELLNDFISNIISEKLGVAPGSVSVSLQVLLGNDIFKL
jgi:hypothetical protein